MGLSWLNRPQCALHNFLVNGRQFVTCPGKETRDHGNAMPDGRRSRGSQRQRLTFAGETVESFSLRSRPTHGPECIAQMLFDEWYFSLYRYIYVLQVRLAAAICGYT